jgi:bifunctional UDP-N-acetylglucosamine pyrophosphorylase / glucosamine-1-phosphate N-acetyltransferase
MNEAPTIIILAAGHGKRMKSAVPKVLHRLLGRTLLGHVLHAAAPLGAKRTVVVVGVGAEQVAEHVAEVAPGAQSVLQSEQLGTGHAVRTALDAVPDASGTVVVLTGDAPLMRTATLEALLATHTSTGAVATVLTAHVSDPSGLGRIVRDEDGAFVRNVEQRDTTPEQAAIAEINAGIYAFDAEALRYGLSRVDRSNAQGEEYLTDVLGILAAAGERVETHPADDADDALGVNDREQLAEIGVKLRRRVNGAHMRGGVTMIDPATTWIDVTVTIGIDATIEPNTQLRGATSIGERAIVGPDTTLTDVAVGAGAQVIRTHGSSSVIGAGASVGPFAYVRPDTDLGEGGKIGTFVETKNATIGAKSKVPHLSYVGDATIGTRSNIGAATIFVNYDGAVKSHTTVGDSAFIGCDTTLIAPVTVSDGAYVAAGSTIVSEVPPGALAVSRGHQRNVEGWVARKRAGSHSADAAEKAIAARAAASDDPAPA